MGRCGDVAAETDEEEEHEEDEDAEEDEPDDDSSNCLDVSKVDTKAGDWGKNSLI